MAPRARKRFGQHWLQSDKALDRIVAASNLAPGDRVLEIGPGRGALTERLLPLAGALLAVELDRDLCPKLVRRFGDRDNFLLLQGDVLDLDWDAETAAFPKFQHPNKVVANIPYNITGPILELLLGTISSPRSRPFEAIVLLVQREVALRLAAPPGSRHYAALSVRVGFLADCDFICDVPAKAFVPPPKVDSAVVRLTPRPYATPPKDPKRMEALLKMGFISRRKMLKNNLKGILSEEQLLPILTDLAIAPTARAEDLSIAQWVALSDRLPASPITPPSP
ncbi:MAG: 16S rRNA (adenine(1518)-N(6)/adenine(1519)-N(6))-dimethyltransferase RsmA [Cyanobacteria bacterium]|nr:16S rRNA (adenine(1518)-N(6)/adenine(1519)-N(6))-dimethyltransferase RsmA [Cyanobacteriota bacterium]